MRTGELKDQCGRADATSGASGHPGQEAGEPKPAADQSRSRFTTLTAGDGRAEGRWALCPVSKFFLKFKVISNEELKMYTWAVSRRPRWPTATTDVFWSTMLEADSSQLPATRVQSRNVRCSHSRPHPSPGSRGPARETPHPEPQGDGPVSPTHSHAHGRPPSPAQGGGSRLGVRGQRPRLPSDLCPQHCPHPGQF